LVVQSTSQQLHKMLLIRVFFTFICLHWGFVSLHAQNFYGLTNTGSLVVFNAQSCQVCQPVQLNGIDPNNLIFNGDIFVTADGNIVVTLGQQLLIYDPPNLNPIVNLSGTSLPSVAGSAAGPNGQVYIVGSDGITAILFLFNPVTVTFTAVGIFPPEISYLTDLFYFGGQLYGIGFGSQVYAVNTTNPLASTNTGYFLGNDLAVADGGAFIGFGTFGQYDPLTGVATNNCSLPAGSPDLLALQQIPATVIPQPSCGNTCTTNAGSVTNTTLNICVPNSANIPYNNNASLDPNDILQYAIVTNPANPAGSLLFVSNTNPVVFDPNFFTPGVTYYMGTVAGNNVNGSVDPNDPCLDFSNMIPVTWRPAPAVTFSSVNTDLCAGNCRTITAQFSGVPPFSLQGQVLLNGSPISTLNNTFNATSGTLQLCAPANSAGGNVTFQATLVTDANCTCN
jgi:hypothetical protein